MTKFSTEKPPMYEVCHKYFGADWDKNIVFAYGDTIHTKHLNQLTPDVIAHEETHLKQQTEFVGGKDAWWDKYMGDENFRISQENEVYKVQIEYARKHYDRNYRRALLQHIYSAFSMLSGGKITEKMAKEILI